MLLFEYFFDIVVRVEVRYKLDSNSSDCIESEYVLK